MMTNTLNDDGMAQTDEPKRELTITRMFDAPRDRVWKAWTDPKVVARWWGPNGVTNPTCEVDARPGGRIKIVMLAGKELGPLEGMEWPMVGTLEEVKPQSRLVMVSGAVDEAQDIFLESRITVELSDLGGKTRVEVHIVVTKINKTERASWALKGMEAGWTQSIDKLGAMLASGN